MPENPQRGVAIVQRQIVDTSRLVSWNYFLADIHPMTRFSRLRLPLWTSLGRAEPSPCALAHQSR
jgi:hypothetical protein